MTTTSADALYGVGHWFFDLHRYEDAKHFFRTMVLLAPADDRGWLALGACHERTNELEKAARLYAVTEAACPHSGRSFIALGRVLQKLDRDVEAAAAYDRAAAFVESDPELAAIVAREQG